MERECVQQFFFIYLKRALHPYRTGNPQIRLQGHALLQLRVDNAKTSNKLHLKSLKCFNTSYKKLFQFSL